MTEIDTSAFWGCTSLSRLDIPSTVQNFTCDSYIDGYEWHYLPSDLSIYFYGLQAPKFDAGFLLELDSDFPGSNVIIYYPQNATGWDAVQRQDDVREIMSKGWLEFQTWTPGPYPVNGATNNGSSTSSADEYIYNTPNPGEDTILDADRLNSVTDPSTAAEAVCDMVGGMSQEQKESPTGIDLATLYAETAVAKAASKPATGPDILINAANIADVAAEAAQTLSAVEDALANSGITTARYLSKTVTLTTSETNITIRIDPDVLGAGVDKVCVETPAYALTFKLSDLASDLTSSLTFKAALANTETLSVANAVDIEVPGGSMANSITVSLPTDKSTDTTYQAVVSSSGIATASKYNPATTDIDGKINTSGTYTIKSNEKDFADIANKSAEMQKAIRYLASKGIVEGTTATTFSPDGSISRAELTKLVVSALGKVDSKATPTFTDVTTANWFYAIAASSQKLGYISGFEDNTFRGNITINKEQIVVVAARVLSSEMN